MAFVQPSTVVISSKRTRPFFRSRGPLCMAFPSSGPAHIPRRSFIALASLLLIPRRALAGLQQFPAREPLNNEYIFMRAGETISLAQENVARTNPVEKLSIRLHGLTPRGVRQSLEAASRLETDFGLGPSSWIWASQNTACQETATVIAKTLRIRQEQVVPEFSFLDARGVGALEGSPMPVTEAALAEADAKGPDTRVPGGEDGTPNESISDVFVRVRQLVSKLETQYIGEQILIIAPDSDTLSILEAAFRDEPLVSHRQRFSFQPGELRKVEATVAPRA